MLLTSIYIKIMTCVWKSKNVKIQKTIIGEGELA